MKKFLLLLILLFSALGIDSGFSQISRLGGGGGGLEGGAGGPASGPPVTAGTVAAWNPATAYTANDLALYTNKIFKRLITGTTVTNPSSDVVNWTQISGDGLPIWNPAKAYLVDDLVRYVSIVYIRLIAGTTGTTPVSDAVNWVPLGTDHVPEQTAKYFTDARAIAAPITGFVSGAGVVAATDTVLQAIQKLDGNEAADEPAITATTSADYYRGDKTFQTLNTLAIPELTNLYFTDARAIAAPLTGYVSGAGVVAATDTTLQAIQKLNGNVVGIGTGTDECIARWNGTGALVLQDSVVCISDLGVITGATQLNVDNLRLDGNDISSTNVNGNVTFTPNGTGYLNLTVATGSIQLGSVDPFSRGQIWNKMANASLRLGSLAQDGDPTDVSSEGAVIYGGPNAQGSSFGGANFIYARVKADRLGLYNSDTVDGAGYIYRIDPTQFFIRSNTFANVFNIQRSTGVATLAGQFNVDNLRLDGQTLSSVSGDVVIDSFAGINFPDLTASTVPVLDASKNLISSAVTPTELGYSSGVTSAIQTQLNAKEGSVTATTSADYYRGDKTFQTLNTLAVPELTNLYYTDARAIAAPLTGYVSGSGVVAATDTVLQAIQKLNGNDALKLPLAGGTVTGSLIVNGSVSVGTLLKQVPITTANRDINYPTPALGDMIFNSTLNQPQYYNGTQWISM